MVKTSLSWGFAEMYSSPVRTIYFKKFLKFMFSQTLIPLVYFVLLLGAVIKKLSYTYSKDKISIEGMFD